jgi:hypothetical protein
MMRCFEYYVKISEAMKRVEFVDHASTYQLLKDDYEYVLLSTLISYLGYESVTFVTILFTSISKSGSEKRRLILLTCQDLD